MLTFNYDLIFMHLFVVTLSGRDFRNSNISTIYVVPGVVKRNRKLETLLLGAKLLLKK